MNLKKYIEELKRRNIFKESMAYLVVAWVIAEASSIILPTFNAPPYILKIILILLGIGFLISLIISWTYNLTPKGLKKNKEIGKSNSEPKRSNNYLNRIIIISLIIVVVILLINQFSGMEKSNNTAQDLNNDVKGNTNLLAVMPFLNTRPDSETDYLGFALADRLIGGLVYLNNIVVRPSSSVRKFENQTFDPLKAGKELKVNYILVGNYLKEDNIIRLNIELINVNTNEIVWRDPVEVSFQSVFELQDIVSKKVVNGLNIQFSQKELNRINRDIPTSALAYEYYLRAISYPMTNRGDEIAIEMVKKSIQLDSGYAPSHALLGSRLHTLANYGLLNPEVSKQAEEYLIKALSLNPELISAMMTLVEMYTETGRIIEAVKLSQKMIEINPNNAYLHFSLAYIYRYSGLNKKAVNETDKALSIDSKNPRFRSSLITYTFAGQLEKALSVLKNFNESSFTIYQYGYVLFYQGKQQECLKQFNRVFELNSEGLDGQLAKAMLSTMQGDKKDARQRLEKVESHNLKDAEPWYFVAQIYGLMNDREGCYRCLRRSIEGGFFNYPFMVRDRFFDAVRDDPEFKKIIEIAKTKHQLFKKELLNVK